MEDEALPVAAVAEEMGEAMMLLWIPTHLQLQCGRYLSIHTTPGSLGDSISPRRSRRLRANGQAPATPATRWLCQARAL